MVDQAPTAEADVSPHPSWFRRSLVPVTLVCGPPASGKSTYVRERAGPSDLVVCFDELARERFGSFGPIRTRSVLIPRQIAAVMELRNQRIAQLFADDAPSKWPAAWIIASESRAEARQWWADHLGAKVVVLLTDKPTCRARMAAAARAGDDRGEEARRYIDRWYRHYSPASCDKLADVSSAAPISYFGRREIVL